VTTKVYPGSSIRGVQHSETDVHVNPARSGPSKGLPDLEEMAYWTGPQDKAPGI
jgi:hypothetical protein